MLNFDTYISRLGKSGVQAIIERIERYEGIPSSAATPLEERWQTLMKSWSEPDFCRAV